MNVKTYISVDGSRNHRDIEENRRCKEIVGEYESRLSKVRSFEENLGLKNHVISSITWAFNEEESLVILEEDLDIEESGIFFLGKCAEDSINWRKIASICGTRIISPNSEIEEISYQRSFASWGWSTNRIIWQDFLLYMTRGTLKDFYWLVINVLRFRTPTQTIKIFRREANNKIDSWATCFQKFIFAKNLLNVIPPINLVVNKGWSDKATHTRGPTPTWVPQEIGTFKNYIISEIHSSKVIHSDKSEKSLRKPYISSRKIFRRPNCLRRSL